MTNQLCEECGSVLTEDIQDLPNDEGVETVYYCPNKDEHVSLFDEDGEVEVSVVNNSNLLYEFIAFTLKTKSALFVRWTDNHGSVYDILFSLPLPVGKPGRGYTCGDLVVAISGKSCFHFATKKVSAAYYYNEKLGVYNEELTTLLNSIRSVL